MKTFSLKSKATVFAALVSSSIIAFVSTLASNPQVTNQHVYSATSNQPPRAMPNVTDIRANEGRYTTNENTRAESTLDETPGLSDELASVLSNLSTEKLNRISDKTRLIASCSSCLEMLKNKFLARQLSPEETTQLAMALTADNHLAIANMLLSVAKESISAFGYDAHSYAIIDALANFDSPQVAKSFFDYFLDEGVRSNGSNSDELSQTLLHNIRQASDFEAVGSDIAKAYFEANQEQQRKILEINHPQALADIILGNGTDAIDVFKSLKNNPDSHVPAALLSLLKNDAVIETDISQAAVDWAAKYAERDTVESIESLLLENTLSQTETDLVKNILLNSPESQAQIVLEKYDTSHF